MSSIRTPDFNENLKSQELTVKKKEEKGLKPKDFDLLERFEISKLFEL